MGLIVLITMIIVSSEKSDESENPARQYDVSSETTDGTDVHRFFLMSHRNKGNNGNNFSANLSARRNQCQRFLREKNRLRLDWTDCNDYNDYRFVRKIRKIS